MNATKTKRAPARKISRALLPTKVPKISKESRTLRNWAMRQAADEEGQAEHFGRVLSSYEHHLKTAATTLRLDPSNEKAAKEVEQYTESIAKLSASVIAAESLAAQWNGIVADIDGVEAAWAQPPLIP